MDPVLLELPVHVLEVHAPDARLIPDQIAVDGLPAKVFQHVGEAHIGGGVEQDLLAGSGEHADGGAYPAQHAVFIADELFFEIRHALAVPVPVQNGLIVGLRLPEITEIGEADALGQSLQDAGGGGEAHVRYPHGDGGKALLHLHTGKGDQVGGDDVMPCPVQHGGEIVCHGFASSS